LRFGQPANLSTDPSTALLSMATAYLQYARPLLGAPYPRLQYGTGNLCIHKWIFGRDKPFWARLLSIKSISPEMARDDDTVSGANVF